MDVNPVMLLIVVIVHTDIAGDTPEMMYLEPLLHLFLDLSNHARVSNDKEVIDIQNDCGNDCALILTHEQSSIDT
jgi:hypothetical protein